MTDHHPDHTESQETPLDAWHQHSPDEGVPQQEHGAHANISALLITFVVLTVATVAFSVIIGLYTIQRVTQLTAASEGKGLMAMSAEAVQYKQDALAAQTGYSWTAAGTVRLPIDQAMQKVVAEYQETQGQ